MDFDLFCDMCEMYLENKKKQLEKTNIIKKKSYISFVVAIWLGLGNSYNLSY